MGAYFSESNSRVGAYSRGAYLKEGGHSKEGAIRRRGLIESLRYRPDCILDAISARSVASKNHYRQSPIVIGRKKLFVASKYPRMDTGVHVPQNNLQFVWILDVKAIASGF